MSVEKLDISTALVATEVLPEAQATDTAATEVVPEDIARNIRHAWGAAATLACITVASALLARSGSNIPPSSWSQLVEAVLIAALGMGIYRKSRVCAVAMFVYFLVSKLLVVAEARAPTELGSGMALGVILAYCYWQGIAGTHAWHRITQKHLQLTKPA